MARIKATRSVGVAEERREIQEEQSASPSGNEVAQEWQQRQRALEDAVRELTTTVRALVEVQAHVVPRQVDAAPPSRARR